ncbi:unnamed protein product [Adineta steineri]|uniref:Uncharacterized protein n=1 Tax=Adineta steineri TaxID=433720 RepID=A0A819WZ24_9BILA|nr:unnamed protein product [Adineta steineri]CAF4131247.1 unnamed protein product [Adineta steineri]
MATAVLPNDDFQTNTAEKSLEIFSLIWLDENVNVTDTRETEVKLRSIFFINHIKKFQDVQRCQQYIEQTSELDQLICIVSSRLGREIVPYIYHLRQVTSIYVYCKDKKSNEQWAHKFAKIKSIVVDLDELVSQITAHHKIQKKVEEPLSICTFTASVNAASVDQLPTHKLQYNNRPIVYIVDLELPPIEWDLDIAQLEKYNMKNQLTDVIRELNSTIPIYILASKPPSDEIMLHAQLMHYYYLQTSPNEHTQTDLKADDRVRSIDSIDQFGSELYEDLGQYYRDEAGKALFDHQDRYEAKQLLEKSEKCFEILERDIEKTLEHYKN